MTSYRDLEFGHKASQPTLRQQIAAAFSGDIGVSSDYFPEQNCPGPQQACRELMAAGKPELGHVRWSSFFVTIRMPNEGEAQRW